MSHGIKDLSFTGDNPGAARYGNFINYYSFHSSKERINNLHPTMFLHIESENIHCLDVGCNTGELTEELYIYLKTMYPKSNIKILGIDIDPTLIERAQERNTNNAISFVTIDITTENGCKQIQEYIKNENKDMFDIVFCFSVTMWIHINIGDLGLQKFLKFLKDNSKSIVIEPQPWKCYKNAQRRMKRSGKVFELFDSLNFRDNVDQEIEDILNDQTHIKIYESPSSSWNRKIQCFHLRE
ncbi:probable RNA methyltransferase CG11342 [Vanessa cardui]|uniref:probable RNA methyltransferase CG11342 n=1 Tax=Vanessa cardui TaxID=171605 RepID=UPI001F13C91A|nr:probable RNA methyltransferase CG11342 [Vanessa cardui]